MLYIREGFPSRYNEICINSIKQSFEHKSPIPTPKRTKTSPEAKLFLSRSPLLKRYETLNPAANPIINERLLPALRPQGRVSQNRRWEEVEREQYDLIRQQIAVSKSRTASIPKGLAFNPSHKHRNHLSSLIDTAKLQEPLPIDSKAQAGRSWIDHIRNINQNRRESFLKNNSGYLFPELFSKLPKITICVQEEDMALASSMELKSVEAEEIFCKRGKGKKRSQMKTRGNKLGQLGARRRRVHTIDCDHIRDEQIAPWRQPIVIARPL